MRVEVTVKGLRLQPGVTYQPHSKRAMFLAALEALAKDPSGQCLARVTLAHGGGTAVGVPLIDGPVLRLSHPTYGHALHTIDIDQIIAVSRVAFNPPAPTPETPCS